MQRHGSGPAGGGGDLAGGRAENVTPPALRTATLYQVAVDGRGRLWIGSNHGVAIEDHGFEVNLPLRLVEVANHRQDLLKIAR